MPSKKPSPDQQEFIDMINENGGVGICVHSVEELEEALKPYLS